MKHTPPPFKAKSFNLHKLHGISRETIDMHFKLYEAYVKHANILTVKIADFLKSGEVAPEKMAEYKEVVNQLSFECNGMKLHEYFFENLKNINDEESKPGMLFMEIAKISFGSYEAWQIDFIHTGMRRGIGWALCCANPEDGKLENIWISLHDLDATACLRHILVMDVWEHAFILDYQASDRAVYIKDFFWNIDWTVVEERCQLNSAPLKKVISNLTSNFRKET